MGVLVHGQLAHANQGIVFFVLSAAKDCLDARNNLIEAKGLGDVVIATDREAGDLVFG